MASHSPADTQYATTPSADTDNAFLTDSDESSLGDGAQNPVSPAAHQPDLGLERLPKVTPAISSSVSSPPPGPAGPDPAQGNSPMFKLPPELRDRIYGYVFSSSEAITPAIRMPRRRDWAIRWSLVDYMEAYSEYGEFGDDDTYEAPVENPIHTSILAVCRFLNKEAMENLYRTKVLRGKALDLDLMVQSQDVSSRARRIEVTDCISEHSDSNRARQLRFLLVESHRFPKLRSIVVLSECLVRRLSSSQDTSISVMKFAHDVGLGPAKCVDIGRYQLQGDFEGVEIVNSRLLEMWPAVRATPENYDGVEDALAMIERHQTSELAANVPAWASHTSLRCWVDIQQQFLALHNSGEWDELTQKAADGTIKDDADDESTHAFFRDSVGASRRNMLDYPLLRDGHHVLRDLEPNSDSRVLNEASDFLAASIEGYRHVSIHASIHPRYEMRRTVWGASWKDTGKTALQYMAEQQNLALSDGASTEFILDPVLRQTPLASNLIDRELAMRWVDRFQRVDWMREVYFTPDTPPEVLKQLTYLHLAVSQCNLPRTVTYHQRRDEWAKGLLQRYILASPYLDTSDSRRVARASLNDLRTIVSTVLEVFHAQMYERRSYSYDGKFTHSFSRDEDPPEDLDDDLYPSLAWGYGKLLAKAFRRYCSQESLAKTLARQWVREGNMWE